MSLWKIWELRKRNNMKLRIISKNNKFYCQFKNNPFFWLYFCEGYADSWVCRDTIEEAESYMNDYVKSRNIELIPLMVVKEYSI